MPEINIPWPEKGISEGRANDEQTPRTTRDAVNVRSVDPTNGRVRGAQRSGMSLYGRDPIAASQKVQDIFSVTYDNKNTDYAAQPLETSGNTSSVTPPNKSSCWQLVLDNQGNVYGIDGKAAIVKYNNDLSEVWKANVELKDEAAEIRTIAVDSAYWIYVGVSTGGDMLKARIYGYEQKEIPFALEGEPKVKAERVWEYDPQGFVEKIEIKDGKLYAAINDTRKGRSWVVVLDQINTAVPLLQKRWDIPYPANDLSVSPKDGSVYTAHEPNTERGRDLQNPSSVGAWVDWVPTQLPSWDKRVWGWWDSSDIDGDGSNNALYEDGDEIQTWYDKSGNGRDWEVNTLTTEKGPILAKNFVAGRDVLVFDGVDRSMMSGTNPSSASVGTDKASRAAFRGAIPSYAGAQYALFMVVRMSPEDVQRYLLSQDVTSTAVDATRRGIVVNSLPNAVGTDTACLTSVRILEDTTSSASTGAGPSTHPLTLCSGPDDFCLITWVFNGGVGTPLSTVRINGRPADQYSSKSTWVCSDATFLGYSRDSSFPATIQRFRGYVCEMLVMSDWYVAGTTPLDTPTRQDILSMPNYPDGAWAAASAATTELELIEGYLANKWGGGYKLSSGTAGTLTVTANPVAAETVTIGGTLYTFRAPLGAAPATGNVDVLVGATTLESITNLYRAINDSGTNGTNYIRATADGANATAIALGVTHSNATATRFSLFIQSRTSASTPTVATTETLGFGAWSAAATAASIAGGGLNVGHYPHKYYYVRLNTAQTRGGPPSSVLEADSGGLTPISKYSNLHLFGGILCKWDPLNAKLKWVVTSGLNGSGATVYGGVGYGCTADIDGGIWSIGPRALSGASVPVALSVTDNTSIRRILDQESTSVSFGSTVTRSLATVAGAANEPVTFKHLRIGVDKYSNGYVPLYNASNYGDTGYDPVYSAYVVSKNDTLLHQYYEPNATHLMHCAVPDTRIPLNLTDDLTGTSQALQPRAERMFMAGRIDNTALLTFVAQPTAADSVTIGSLSYTFRSGAFIGAPVNNVEVAIGPTLAQTISNLRKAVNNTGTPATDYQYNGTAVANTKYRATITTATTLRVRQIVPLSTIESITSDLATTNAVANNALWNLAYADLDRATVHRATLITSTPDSGSPRTTRVIAVGGNTLKRIVYNQAPSGSLGAFTAAGSQYISSTVLGQRAYLTNGEEYLYYDAKSDTVSAYKATSAGVIPKRCKLISNWRNRIILARGADDPQNWHMSAVGDPHNWDLFPPVTLPTQAVSGNNSRAGRCPDIINAIIPYSDDLLIMGGDSSIWRMTGDPMAGGQLDLLSDVDGIAFGHAWDKDDSGALYFFGARGGLYKLSPSGGMRKISSDAIDNRLRDINLGTYNVRCVWNDDEDTLHIFAMPFGSGGTHVKHFAYEAKTGAFWQDEFGSTSLALSGATNVQPTAAYVLDGDDPDDRTILVGCEDGYIRKWDKSASNDGDVAANSTIDSYVTFGPISMGRETESRLSALNLLLAKEQQGCRLQLFVSDTPDDLGIPVWTGDFAPGRNDWRYIRGRGRYLWIRIRNSLFSSRWAFENMSARVDTAGRARVRYT